MQIRKQDFVQFKNHPAYYAAQEDVREAVQRALAEVLLTEDISTNRQAFLRGFVQGCSAILDWEPDFVDEEDGNNAES